MPEPWVSVIIPCHDDGETVERAVGSALAQGVPAEVVIVDDASGAPTRAALDRLARERPEVVLLRNERNRGAAASRNRGAAAARAEYLCFLDADDEHLPGFYARACFVLDEQADVAAVKGALEWADLPAGMAYDYADPRHAQMEFTCPGNFVIRRAAFAAMGGFPEHDAFRGGAGGEDVAFMTALARRFEILLVRDRVYRAWCNHESARLADFLARTRVVDGRVEWLKRLDGEIDGSFDAAYAEYERSIDAAAVAALPCARR